MKYLRKFNENNSNDNKKDLILKYFSLVSMELAINNYQYMTDLIYKTINSVKDAHHIKEFMGKGLTIWLYNYKIKDQIANFTSLNNKGSQEILDTYNKLLNNDIKLAYSYNGDIEFEQDYIDEIKADNKLDEYEKRYDKLFQSKFKKLFQSNEFDVECQTIFRPNSNIVYIYLAFIINEPILFDIFKEPIKAITEYPTLVNYLHNYVSDEDFYELVNEHPGDLKDILTDNALLKYTKHSKLHEDPERYEMEESNYCYLLLCKDKFTENEDGTYTKDLDIESILKIDPYDKEEYGSTVSGMKMRARFQEGLSLNIIWLPKEYEIDNDDINSDENRELRKSIKKTMEVIR